MAGVAGFEPTNGGTRNRCLTTWRHPKTTMNYIINQKDVKIKRIYIALKNNLI